MTSKSPLIALLVHAESGAGRPAEDQGAGAGRLWTGHAGQARSAALRPQDPVQATDHHTRAAGQSLRPRYKTCLAMVLSSAYPYPLTSSRLDKGPCWHPLEDTLKAAHQKC